MTTTEIDQLMVALTSNPTGNTVNSLNAHQTSNGLRSASQANIHQYVSGSYGRTLITTEREDSIPQALSSLDAAAPVAPSPLS